MSINNNQQKTKEEFTAFESFDHVEEMKVMEIDQKIDSYKSLQSQLETALLVFTDHKAFPKINTPKEVEDIDLKLRISEQSLLSSDLGYEFLLNSHIEKIVSTIDWDCHNFENVPNELVYLFLDKYGENNLPKLNSHINYQIKHSLVKNYAKKVAEYVRNSVLNSIDIDFGNLDNKIHDLDTLVNRLAARFCQKHSINNLAQLAKARKNSFAQLNNAQACFELVQAQLLELFNQDKYSSSLEIFEKTNQQKSELEHFWQIQINSIVRAYRSIKNRVQKDYLQRSIRSFDELHLNTIKRAFEKEYLTHKYQQSHAHHQSLQIELNKIEGAQNLAIGFYRINNSIQVSLPQVEYQITQAKIAKEQKMSRINKAFSKKITNIEQYTDLCAKVLHNYKSQKYHLDTIGVFARGKKDLASKVEHCQKALTFLKKNSFMIENSQLQYLSGIKDQVLILVEIAISKYKSVYQELLADSRYKEVNLIQLYEAISTHIDTIISYQIPKNVELLIAQKNQLNKSLVGLDKTFKIG